MIHLHTPNEDYTFDWGSDNTSNDQCDEFDAGEDDFSEDEGDNLDFDADKDDYSLEESDNNDCDRDDDPFVNCKVCNKPVSSSFLKEHLENQHKCNYCNDCDYMNTESLETHIKEAHMIKCKHCNVKKLTNEIAQHELSHTIVSMIQMNKLTDERFNQLVAENRVYAIEGNLYIKEDLTLSEQLSKVELK